MCIWGCCIERDCFGIPREDSQVQIDKYLSFSSPLSFTEDKIKALQSVDFSELKVDTGFRRRNMEFD